MMFSKNKKNIQDEKIEQNNLISQKHLYVETKLEDNDDYSFLDIIPHDGLFDKDSYNELIYEAKYIFEPIHTNITD